MANIDIKNRSIHALADDLENKVCTSAELVEAYLERIDREDGTIGAFLKLNKEHVRLAAKESDRRRAAGAPLSRYDGIPIGIKDCIVVEDETCSCASKALEGVVSPYDATVVARLKAHGFLPLGRLNMDEFAMGSSCEHSAFQNTHNPHDAKRVAGGSSGGSAACVAASFAPAALGSDTGGSIRQPAAFCGVVGLKPTYGRVSRNGLVAFASSLDQVGPLTSNVEDAAILLDIIAGHDPLDSTSLPLPAGGYLEAVRNAPNSLKGKKIGLPKEYFEAGGLSKGVESVIRESIERAKALGAEIVDVSLPHTKYAVAVYCIVATAEASANLARFDGMRYGKRSDSKDLLDTYLKSRGAGFGDEVKRRILLGTYVLSSGYYDAYYLKAQKVRTLIRRDFEEAFKQCDLLLTPVTPDVAFEFGAKSDPLQMYLSDIFTIALNLSGNCGISLPAGMDSETGMPVGIQLLAPALAEAELLSTAQTLTR